MQSRKSAIACACGYLALWLNVLKDLAEYTIREKGIKEKIQEAFMAKYSRGLTDNEEEDLTYLINGEKVGRFF